MGGQTVRIQVVDMGDWLAARNGMAGVWRSEYLYRSRPRYASTPWPSLPTATRVDKQDESTNED